MKYPKSSIIKLWQERITDKQDVRYWEATNKRPLTQKVNTSDIITEKELLEILWDLRELTLEKVLNLLCCDLIQSSLPILLEISKINEKLINELWFEVIKTADWICVKKKNKRLTSYYRFI